MLVYYVYITLVYINFAKTKYRVGDSTRRLVLVISETFCTDVTTHVVRGYYQWLIGSCIRPFDWYQNQRPWITLNGRSKHAFFGTHHENLNEETTVGLSITAISSVFAGYFFGNFRGQHYIAIRTPSSVFQWSQNAWPWMTLNGHFVLNVVFALVCLASDNATFVKTNKDRPMSAAQIFTSAQNGGDIRFMRNSRGFSRKDASKDSGVAR